MPASDQVEVRPHVFQQGPVAAYAYAFDEGVGSTVEDLTGDEHTATIEGAEWRMANTATR